MNINSQEWQDLVKSGLDSFSVSADRKQIDQLTLHASEMLAWNKTTNLTSIKAPAEVAVKHVVDSAAIVNECTGFHNILDIGTGGGFPGIPLSILLPDLQVTLVETIRKKVTFLKHVIRSAGLKNIQAIQARGEELSGEKAFGGHYDAVVCRAFSGLDNFVNMAVPYLKDSGVLLAMKGREKDHEKELLKNVETCMASGRKITYADLQIDLREYKLPLMDSDRALFIIRIKP